MFGSNLSSIRVYIQNKLDRFGKQSEFWILFFLIKKKTQFYIFKAVELSKDETKIEASLPNPSEESGSDAKDEIKNFDIIESEETVDSSKPLLIHQILKRLLIFAIFLEIFVVSIIIHNLN